MSIRPMRSCIMLIFALFLCACRASPDLGTQTKRQADVETNKLTNTGVSRDSDQVAYRFITFNRTNGLPSNSIQAIKDYKGRLWVGTGFGLASSVDRGQTWRIYTSRDGILESRISELWVDGDRLWAKSGEKLFVTNDGGDSWTQIIIPEEYEPILVHRNKIWIYTPFMDYSGSEFPKLMISDDQGKNWSALARTGLEYISAIYPDDDNVWIANEGMTRRGFIMQGLFRKKIQSQAMDEVTSIYRSIESEGSIGSIWINKDSVWLGGSLHYENPIDAKKLSASFDDGETWTSFGISDGILKGDITAIWGNEQCVWIGTDEGVSISCDTGDSWQSYTAREGLVSASIHVIWGDADGDIWIGSGNGLVRAIPIGVTSYTQIPNATINSIWGSGETLWIGTNAGVSVSHDNGETWRSYTSSDGLPYNMVSSLWGNGRGEVWLAKPELGLTDDSGSTWHSIETRSIVESVCGEGNTRYVVTRCMDGFATWRGCAGVIYSEDGGITWNEGGYIVEPGYGLEIHNGTFDVLAVDDTVWATFIGPEGSVGLRVSRDRALTWQTVGSPETPVQLQPRASELGRAVWWDGEKLWAGGYRLAYTKDMGITWSYSESWNLLDAVVNRIVVDEGNVWVLSYKGLFLSQDTGKTWTPIESPLSAQDIEFFKGDMWGSNGKLWIASSDKLYISSNNGQSWKDVYNPVNEAATEAILKVPSQTSEQLTVTLTTDLGSWQSITEGIRIEKNGTLENVSFAEIGIVASRVNGIQAVKDNIWVITNGGIAATKDEGKNWISHPFSDNGSSSGSLFVEWHDNLWIIDSWLVSRFDTEDYANDRPINWQQFYSYSAETLVLPEPITSVAFSDSEITFGGEVFKSSYQFSPPVITLDEETLELCGSEIKQGATHVAWQIDAPFISHPNDLAVRYRIKTPSDTKLSDLPWTFLLNTDPLRQGRLTFDTTRPGDYQFEIAAGDHQFNWSAPQLCDLGVESPPSPWPYIVAIVVGSAVSAWGALVYFRRQQRRVGYNPFIVGAPITDRKQFFGRRETLRGILDSLHGNHVFVQGGYRSGKTSLLRQLQLLLKEAIDQNLIYIPAWLNLQDISSYDLLFYTIEQTVVDTLYRVIDAPTGFLQVQAVPPEDYTYLDLRSSLRLIEAALKNRVSKEPRIILLIDEADRLSGYPSEIISQFRSFIESEEATILRVVIAGTELPKHEEGYGSPFYNVFAQVNLTPLTRNELEQLISQLTGGIYRFEQAALDQLWSISQGWPYCIQQLGRLTVERFGQEKRGVITKEHILAVLEDAGDACSSDHLRT